jgi:hypothetical protein
VSDKVTTRAPSEQSRRQGLWLELNKHENLNSIQTTRVECCRTQAPNRTALVAHSRSWWTSGAVKFSAWYPPNSLLKYYYCYKVFHNCPNKFRTLLGNLDLLWASTSILLGHPLLPCTKHVRCNILVFWLYRCHVGCCQVIVFSPFYLPMFVYAGVPPTQVLDSCSWAQQLSMCTQHY